MPKYFCMFYFTCISYIRYIRSIKSALSLLSAELSDLHAYHCLEAGPEVLDGRAVVECLLRGGGFSRGVEYLNLLKLKTVASGMVHLHRHPVVAAALTH